MSNLIEGLAIFVSAGHHSVLQFIAAAASLIAGSVHLVERRGTQPEVTPTRQIDISTLLESMPEAVFVFDAAGQIIEANSAAENLLLAKRAELKGLDANSIAAFVAEHAVGEVPPEQVVVSRALRGETVPPERRRVNITSRGISIEVFLSANPIRDAQGGIVGALVIMRDVTELATLQRLLQDTERHNAIGKMAAALSHDFNNVLLTISQAASVLEIDVNRSVEERGVILRMIRNAVKRGTEITGSVRQYLTSGSSEVGPVDINQVLEETIELTRPLWQATRKISIVRQFQPVSRVRANVAELRRVFTNLVMNALEAMPNGGILTVGCEQAPRRVRAFVDDTGEGIPAERNAKIFVPYFTTKNGGTGLGLANAHRAILEMGGNMRFSSEVGKGTRFEVELPLEQEGRRAA